MDKSKAKESAGFGLDVGNASVFEETTNRAIWGTWNKPYDFTITVIGYVLGIHNFWRFPFLCYKYGGAFFLPYIIVLLFLGIPCVFMELTIGQYFSVGPTDAFHQMAPILTSVSYLLALNSMSTCGLYTMMISWSRFYSSDSTSCHKGWETCYKRHFYNTPECYTAENDDSCNAFGRDMTRLERSQPLERLYHGFNCIPGSQFCSYFEASYDSEIRSCTFNDSRKPFRIYSRRHNAIREHFYGEIMGLQYKREVLRRTMNMTIYSNSTLYEEGRELVVNDESHSQVNMKIYAFTTWILVVIFLYEGLLAVSAVSYVLTLLPFILLLAFTAKALSLDKAARGMDALFNSRDFIKDLSNPDIWAEAIVQGVITTGVGTGVLVTMATFNKFHHKFIFDSYFTLFLNLMTSGCACIMCYCTIGHYVKYYSIVTAYNDTEFFDYLRTESTVSSIEFGYLVYTHFLTLIHDQAYAPFLFFFMMSSFATDSSLRLTQMALDRVVASFPVLGQHRFSALLGICLFGFIGLWPMTQNGGFIYFVDYEYFTLSFLSPIVSLIEVASFAWIYTAESIAKRAEDMKIIRSSVFRWYFIASVKFIAPSLLIFSLVTKFVNHTRIRFNGRPAEMHLEVLGWLLTLSPILIFVCSTAVILIKTPVSEWKVLFEPVGGKLSRHSSLGQIWQQAMLDDTTSPQHHLNNARRLDDPEAEKQRKRNTVRFHLIPNAPLSRRNNFFVDASSGTSSSSSMSVATAAYFGSAAAHHRSTGTDAATVTEQDEVIGTEGNVTEEFWKTIMMQIMSYFLDWPGRFDEQSDDEGSSEDSDEA